MGFLWIRGVTEFRRKVHTLLLKCRGKNGVSFVKGTRCLFPHKFPTYYAQEKIHFSVYTKKYFTIFLGQQPSAGKNVLSGCPLKGPPLTEINSFSDKKPGKLRTYYAEPKKYFTTFCSLY